ncbi:hypothetical protein [Paenibacillus polymyxa]|uniref:hypothetical protein n=1 Tax=Paenibacillus polymyxa TaxID=1406 RepID=UPI0007EAD486|nr:hypothetical protein [Paenibacillus polymyxa]MDN4081407.1 hypothetical protein [Paenibacillus polymyxa]MDN4109738.1 hypothetical protein [Paenibacillus polymyxa]OAZ42748.1 hypothetical protein A9Z39_22615 [Paenibacillus polymyxa]
MVQKNPANHTPSTLEEMNFRPAASKHTSRPISKKSVLSVVSHKNGTRIAVDIKVIEELGDIESVQIALNHEGIAIGEEFTGDDNYFRLMKAANKAVIYSSQLVKELTEAFNLDFENVSSISFQDVEYLQIESRTVAFIKMIRNEAKWIDEPTTHSSNDAANDPDTNNTDDGELDFDSEDDKPHKPVFPNQRKRKRSA